MKRLFSLLAIGLTLMMAYGAEAGPLRDYFASRSQKGGVDEEEGASDIDAGSLLAGTKMLRDVAYGSDAKQKMDVYIPPHANQAPVLMMIHGGGWRVGDKASSGVVTNKAKHWLARGFIFISINNRLLPDADPLAQADDAAMAVAFAERQAPKWGGDPTRFILMGHSAGAHLAALLSADPSRVIKAGGSLWKGSVMLDSGALNVTEIMREKHFRLYDNAFGDKPSFWKDASPVEHITAQARPMLLICSSKRQESCPQAHAFAERAKSMGVSATVQEEALSHREINVTLGEASDYTQAVDRFIDPLVATAPK